MLSYFWICYAVPTALTLSLMIIAALAYQYNQDFSDILLYRNHVEGTYFGKELVDDGRVLQNQDKSKDSNLFDISVRFMTDGISVLDNIRSEIKDVNRAVSSSISDISSLLDGTSVVESGTDALMDELLTIETRYSDKQINVVHVSSITGETQTHSFACEFCTRVSNEVQSIRLEMEAQTESTFQDLLELKTSVNSELVAQEQTITDSLNVFVKMMNDTIADFSKYRKDLVETRPDLIDYNNYREMFYNGLFAIPLVPLLLLLIAGVFRKPFLFTCGYSFLWLSSFVMFALLIVHWPIAAVFNDSCGYLSMIEKNITHFVSKGGSSNSSSNETETDVAAIVQSCFENTRLLDVFGQTDQLNFTNAVQIPSFGNLSSIFEFQGLDGFNDDAQTLDESTFYSSGDSSLSGIQDLIAVCSLSGCDSSSLITRSNFQTFDPDSFYDKLEAPVLINNASWYLFAQLLDVLFAEQLTLTQFMEVVSNISDEMSSVMMSKQGLENETTHLVNRLSNADGLLAPIFSEVDEVVDVIRCGFIGHGYLQLTDILCNDFLSVVASCISGMLSVALISIFSCVFVVKLVRRSYWMNYLQNRGTENDEFSDENSNRNKKQKQKSKTDANPADAPNMLQFSYDQGI